MEITLKIFILLFVISLVIYAEITFFTIVQIDKIDKKDKIALYIYNTVDEVTTVEFKGLTFEKALQIKREYEKAGKVVYLTILTQGKTIPPATSKEIGEEEQCEK